MSILSLIKTSANVLKTAVTSPIKSLTAGVQAVAVAVANPTTLLTQGYTKAYEKTASSSLTTNISKIILNTGAVATSTLAVGTTAGRAVATKVVKTAVKNPVSTLSTAVLTPIAYGVVTTNPIGIGESVVKTGENLATFGADFADFQAFPSTDRALDLVKKHPTAIIASVIASGLLTGTALTLLKGAYDAYKYNQVTDAISDIKIPDTKPNPVIIEDKKNDSSSQPIINIYNPPQAVAQTAPIITPAVASSPAVVPKKTTKKKAKKKAVKKKTTKKKAKKKAVKKKKSIKRKKTSKKKKKNGK